MNWVQLRGGLTALALALLAACGGGKGQIEPFKPTRLISFGDEQSLLTADGKRYGVNALKTGTTTGEVDCTGNPIWVQTLTSHFSLVLAQCNPDNKPVTAFLRGAVGAKVADVKAQIDQQLASGSVGPKDLLLINAGFYDILEAYQQFPTRSEADLIGLLQQRGRALADQVNRLANANGRVVVLTAIDPGLTPAGQQEKASKTDTDRAALLTRLTNAFNVAMRLALIEDGRNQLLLRGPIALDCPLRILQGQQDPDVPWRHALRIAEAATGGDVRVTLIKDGDHRLSREPDLAVLGETVAALL